MCTSQWGSTAHDNDDDCSIEKYDPVRAAEVALQRCLMLSPPPKPIPGPRFDDNLGENRCSNHCWRRTQTLGDQCRTTSLRIKCRVRRTLIPIEIAAPPRKTSRGFVHWRFSDVGHISAPYPRCRTTSEKPTQLPTWPTQRTSARTSTPTPDIADPRSLQNGELDIDLRAYPVN